MLWMIPPPALVVFDGTNPAEALARARDWKGLREAAEARLRTAPNDAGAWRHLGLASAGSGDREGALRCVRRLASLRPADALALLRDPLLLPLLYDPAHLGVLQPAQVRVLGAPPPPLAPALNHEEAASILLNVVVDGDGSVIGMRALTGSPALRAAAEGYVVQWVLAAPPDGRPSLFQVWVRLRAPGGRADFRPWEFNPMGGTGRHDHSGGGWTSGPR